MEIDNSPKLTRASNLIASVSSELSSAPSPVVNSLDQAEKNNREAATEISKLTSDPKTSAVADENRIASRIKPEEVDNFAEELKGKILKFPDVAKDAVASSTKLTADLVRGLLS